MDDFEAWLDARIRTAVEGGAAGFQSLLIQLGDVNPTALLESVHRLAALAQVTTEFEMRIREEAAHKISYEPPPPHHRFLPVPHPLDYDWRFSDSATEYLLSEHLATGEDGLLVCLGAPSVLCAARLQLPISATALLDADEYLISLLRRTAPAGTILHCDLLADPLPAWRARTIIADPPWYPEYIRAFLWCGRKLLEEGGRLLLSVPPEGTRPGIAHELEEEIEWAEAVGLQLRALRRGQVRYITPPFEHNAMRARGIRSLPSEWRTGDIAEFEFVQREPPPRPFAVAYDSPWVEMAFGSIRIRIGGERRMGAVDPRLVPLVPGDILPTVSRRDPRRSQVRVWTSGNRVYGCVDPECLRTVAAAFAAGEKAEAAVEMRLGRTLEQTEIEAVRIASLQLEELVKVEWDEYGRLWDGSDLDPPEARTNAHGPRSAIH